MQSFVFEMHNHSHDHDLKIDRAFKIGLVLNLALVIAQAIFGLLSNSLALLADAGHNLSDVLGLAIAWGAVWLARRRASVRHTYGLRKASIFSPLLNSSLLLGVTAFLGLEAIQRALHPQPVAGNTVIIVALVGVVINGLTAKLLHGGHDDHDLNRQGAFIHMLADMLVSVGVVISGVVITLTGWQWVDPLTTGIIAIVILLSTTKLFQTSLNLALDGVPGHIDLVAIQTYLSELPGVGSIHDCHVWAMSSTEPALTVHLVMLAGVPQADFLSRVNHDLHHKFGIEHSTIQLETGSSLLPCAQANCGI
jgi:cobalt-zinc-cadmium efflux system protein